MNTLKTKHKNPDKNKIISKSPSETFRIAEKFALRLPDGPITVALYGNLGTGKTCFTQGVALALGVNQPVSSPTFTIINEYRGNRIIFHADLYRIKETNDLVSLGLDDCLSSNAVTLIEWAERIEPYLPNNTIYVYFTIPPDTKSMNTREIKIDDPNRLFSGSDWTHPKNGDTK